MAFSSIYIPTYPLLEVPRMSINAEGASLWVCGDGWREGGEGAPGLRVYMREVHMSAHPPPSPPFPSSC